MKKATRKKGNTGKRYSVEERKKIIAFVRKQGRGGITAACRQFGVSYIALRRWMKNGVAGAPRKGRGGSGPSALDGRKLRSLKNALTSVKLLRRQAGKIQSVLQQLAK